MTQGQNKQDFYDATDKMQAHLDSFIETGSDQELFIASYLHGHFDVAVADTDKKLESAAENFSPIAALQERLSHQLEKAFANEELSSEDAAQVSALVKALFQ
jgi:hypothetical protein